MADTPETMGGNGQEQFMVQAVYTKDLSLESPNSPSIFTQQWGLKAPELQISKQTQKLEDGNYEAVLKITATVKTDNGEKTAFLVEVHQAGIFTIKGFPNDHIEHMLHTFCMFILFPYAREAISNTVMRAAFPPLLLPHIDFEAMYHQQLQKSQQQPKANGSGQ